MAHDVFISYSSSDKATADAVCALLETRGIRCWIAPRDILPGTSWAEAIIDAIGASRAMVLIFSERANKSVQIHREVERAVNRGLNVIPLRIENAIPSKTMEYFISTPHWLDALTPPLDQHVVRLADALKVLLSSGDWQPAPTLEERGLVAATPGTAAEGAGEDATAPAVFDERSTFPRLSRYALARFIGPGRMGSEVYAGTHTLMGNPVAVRVLRKHGHPAWDVARERLLREAQSLQLTHPSVMQVRDFGEEGDFVFVVTEMYDAVGLRALLEREGHLPWPRMAPLVGQLLSAASAVHRRGHLLCGLSPEIILITKDPDEQQGERLMVSTGGVSQVGDVMGMLSEASLRGTGRPNPEVYYMAPELFIGGSPDLRSEVFTLAAVIYEMATGRPPFNAPTFPLLLGAMLQTRPPDPREVQAELPANVVDGLLAALASDPARRPDTPGALGSMIFSKPRP